MVLHEEEAQGELGLRQEPGGGHQEHVDKRHRHQVLPESRRHYAQEDYIFFIYPMLVSLFSNFKVNLRKINFPRTPYET
jgi:hypothetical protein